MKHWLSHHLVAAAVLTLTACQDRMPTGLQPTTPEQARGGAAIPGEWIVVFDADVPDSPGLARQLTAAHQGSLRFTYQHALRGFAASLPEAAVRALRNHPRVAYIEADQPVHAVGSQLDPPWGLDRVDQRANALDDVYNYPGDGAGVNVYVIDTGIRLTHRDFSGRASSGFDAIDGGSADDCNGHGTHVAGTVGGTTWGVAKSARLVAVRVLDCQGSGTTSGVIAGVDWVTSNHTAPAVANMSLGGGASSSLDQAVRNSIVAGVSYSVAAGNGDFLGRQRDACNYSPARVAEAMTIGATDASDRKASWSNYGACVDWFAPGVSITSTWIDSDTDSHTISGTSMAAPHAAGVAALYLQAFPSASPQSVRDALYGATTKSIVSSSNTANNHLLYSLVADGNGGTINSPPSASFTFSCTELACDFYGSASSDSDGSIAGYAWRFGDGATATGPLVSHAYAAGGTYSVELTVTDDDGATGKQTRSVTVASSGGGSIELSAAGSKVRGRWQADLSWTGATSASVDVYRDGAAVAVTPNDGAYTDATERVGGGSLSYRVCEAGTATCSNHATATF